MIYTIGIDSMFPEFKTASIEEAVSYCRTKEILGVDSETSGLDWLVNEMLMFQIGDQYNQYVIDTRTTSILPFKEILESKEIIKVLHNVSFDDKFLRKMGITLSNVWDTMNMNKVLTCGLKESNSLKAVLTKTFPNEAQDIDKDTRNQFVNLRGTPFTKKQIIYGADDIKLLPKLQKVQFSEILSHNLMEVAVLENKAVLAFSDIEYNGIGFNSAPWLKLGERSKEEAIEVEYQLDDYIYNNPKLKGFIASSFQGDLFLDASKIRKIDIDWNSPKQVLNVFKQDDKPELEGVNATELMKYMKDPFIRKYLQYKKKMKLASAYGKDFLKNVKSDGRIHTHFNQILETGRVSSSGPNVQQIPATNEYRNCFISGYPEYVFVSSDYSSQELAVIAYGSKDPVWLKALEEKKDLHSVCADLVYGQEWLEAAEEDCMYMKNQQKCDCPNHKTLRTGVKTINFGLA